MTREEAINLLDLQLHGTPEQIEQHGSYEHAIAIRIAIEALQKQIPQKPTIENGFVKCPACELYIRFPIMDRYNNCPECGQALKWEDDGE